MGAHRPGDAGPCALVRPGFADFLLVYVLAHAGGTIGCLPLLTLLLPVNIERIAGIARLDLLATIAVVGADIGFGWLSDRSFARARTWAHGRRTWMASGLAATALSYVGLTAAAAPVALVGAVALFQLSINALLAPLAAIMTDERTRCAERRAGGLLTLAGPAASALTATLAGIPMLRETTRLAIIPAVVAVRVLLLLATRARPVPSPVRT